MAGAEGTRGGGESQGFLHQSGGHSNAWLPPSEALLSAGCSDSVEELSSNRGSGLSAPTLSTWPQQGLLEPRVSPK